MTVDLGIPRPRYLSRIRPYVGAKLIKAIVGQRRVGKSYVLAQAAQVIRSEHPDWSVVFIDLERIEWRHLRAADDLIAAVREGSGPGKTAVFLDEIQEIEGFARVVRGLAADERWDVYISGSNADLLSSDMATLFAGRAISVQVHPLSYDEFLTFHGLPDDDDALRRYLRRGGLPFLHRLPADDAAADEYLRAVLDSVVLKDVVMRHGIRSPALLERIVEFVADNVGSPTSGRNVASYLRSRGIGGSAQSVLDYLGYLVRSYAVARCAVADTVGKRLLEGLAKYYFEDLGLRASVRGSGDTETGKIVESAVFARLRVDGWDVSAGRVGDREIDFVCQKAGEVRYVQAAYLVPDGPTREWEFGALLAADGAWPRFVVSMDPLPRDWQGVRHLRLRDFLRDGLPE